jgi:hypothetical protein
MMNISEVTYKDCYVESKFRESRDEKGRLTFISGQERLGLIGDKHVIDLDTGKIMQINELLL